MLLKLMEKLLGYALIVPIQKRKIEIPTPLSFRSDSPSLDIQHGFRVERTEFPLTICLDIAVIGYSCRFPSAPTIGEYWELLRDGVEPVTFFSKYELIQAGYL